MAGLDTENQTIPESGVSTELTSPAHTQDSLPDLSGVDELRLAQAFQIDLREGTNVETSYDIGSSSIDPSAKITYQPRVGDIQSMYSHAMMRDALNGGKSVVDVYNENNGTNIPPTLGCALNLWYRQIAPALTGLSEEDMKDFSIEEFMESPEVARLENYIANRTGGFNPAYIPSIIGSLQQLGWVESATPYDTSQGPEQLRAGDILLMEWPGDSGPAGHSMTAVALDPTLTRGQGSNTHAVVTTITGGSGLVPSATAARAGDLLDRRSIDDFANPTSNSLSPYGNRVTDFTVVRLDSEAIRAAQSSAPVQISEPLSLEFLSQQGIQDGKYLMTEEEIPQDSPASPFTDRFVTDTPRPFSGTPLNYSR